VAIAGIIFDGDDTLWETMPHYVRAKRDFYNRMALMGFEVRAVEEKFEQIDLDNLARLGFSRSRFPTSMVNTYQAFCRDCGQPEDDLVAGEIASIAENVFNLPAIPLEGAPEVLTTLAESYRLFLLTKGDPQVQQRRINDSGLKGFFSAIYIVPDKSASDFRRIVRDQELSVETSWSVGNSLRSDINPALAIGLSAIWIPYYTWDAEIDIEVPSDRLIKLDALKQILRILETQRIR
jgi:putative hydrolase of the HAD superfamily